MGKHFSYLAFFALILINFSAFAQPSVKSSAGIRASLMNGLSLGNSTSSLNFRNTVNPSESYLSCVDPQSGIMLNVTGRADHKIFITFNEVKLNITKLLSGSDVGIKSFLFTPLVQHSGCSSTCSAPTEITSGSCLDLGVDRAGFGKLYLWVGGSLNIDESQHSGNYEGMFSINIAY